MAKVSSSQKQVKTTTSGKLRRFFAGRFVTVALPLVIVTAFCFVYLQYRADTSSAISPKTDASQQPNGTSKTSSLPSLNSLPLSSAPTLKTTAPTTVTGTPPSTITSTAESDQVTNSLNPGEATTTPLQSNTSPSTAPTSAPLQALVTPLTPILSQL